jgi:osmotically-inducible protein OsmY
LHIHDAQEDDQLRIAGDQSPAAQASQPPQAQQQPAGSQAQPQAQANATERDAQPGADADSMATRILARYFVTPEVRDAYLEVTGTSEGVVTLEGEVESQEARQIAERVARNTEGVTRVANRLRVRGEQVAATGSSRQAEDATAVGTGGRQADAWVTRKVQAKYFLDDDVKGRDIDVTTRGGRSVGEAIEDGWITTQVQAKYFVDPDVKGHEVNVDTRNGVVTLKGTVNRRRRKPPPSRSPARPTA